MAQEGSEASVTSSSTNSWWQEINHASATHQSVPNIPWTGSAVSRWTQMPIPPQQHCEGDVSVSHPASSLTGSGLTVDSNSHVETHLWSQVLMSTGGDARGVHQRNDEDGGNFLDLLNSKTLAPEMFDLPACDYLKKIDTTTTNASWEFAPTSSVPLNPLANYSPNPNPNSTEPGLSHLSDLVSNWSIAPPNTNSNIVAPPSQCNTTIFPPKTDNNFLDSNHVSHIKHENPNLPSYGSVVMSDGRVNYQDFGSPMSSFLRSCQLGMSNNPVLGSVLGLNNKLRSGLMEAPWCNNGTRSLSDIISFSGSLSKPTVDLKGFNACAKSSDTTESRKLRPDSPARTSSRGSGTSSEGKKKRSEEGSEAAHSKKSKQETSTTSSPKQVQVPKVKMAEKITALQQIVSPFGKTDTASVLLEAINYIKFLHEQVQLLSDPYMKSGANKDYNAWITMERKEKSETSQDLRSRGLCLVPISCTPQLYRDSNAPDYWTPPYRSCLYR
ncbi:basic helix-loop-helix (bHLH) DNA-binding superfamily protein [Rhynchospora pubera]|uniref:Basic helix-loop-helix (BHLH) DNA-binding superfamily protein n=1 Tax=Rhynchospora pubera TaxID=906938 RepID=A0AAV8BMX4_9POAL|nr:basic helix-loop-helix (bHLH) DNA-binding superfamily protein [Rhynchospora pubera]